MVCYFLFVGMINDLMAHCKNIPTISVTELDIFVIVQFNSIFFFFFFF